MNSSETLIEARVLRRRQEADGIVSLDLCAAQGGVLPRFEAGAHIDIHLGQGLVRQYSLCGDPGEPGLYRLGILNEAGGRGGSEAVHRDVVEGSTVRIGAPRNSFRLVEDARYSVLLAGGIGITPMLAMAHRLQRLGRPFELHYCCRSPDRTAFREDLTQASFAQKAHIHHDDGPPDQTFDPATQLPTWLGGDHLYVCGPKGFMDWVTAGAKVRGWEGAAIHTEYFSAEVDATGDTFSVEARRSGKTFSVPSGRSIAEVMVELGIDIPLSCEQGVCGTCLVDVLDGVPDHRDFFQSDEERDSNKKMTPCCSRSLSPRLVLDI